MSRTILLNSLVQRGARFGLQALNMVDLVLPDRNLEVGERERHAVVRHIVRFLSDLIRMVCARGADGVL